jgi:hypothetical protein
MSATGRVEPDPIPAELLADRPPGELWAPTGVPPAGFWALMRLTETRIGWLVTCASCLRGWCRLLPDPGDPSDYVLDLDQACSRDCDPGDIAWWHLWRLGEIPPREPVEADERHRRYVEGAARHAARRIVQAPDPATCLRREAYELGRLAAGTGVNPALIAKALAAAAAHAGLPENALVTISKNVAAGTALPRRMPA